MVKLSIAFLAGTLFATGCMVAAGGRAPLMIGLGAFVALGVVGGIMWLAGLRRVVRFLNAFADGLASSGAGSSREAGSVRQSAPRISRVPDRSGYVKPSRRQQLQVLSDTVDEYRNKETADFLNDAELFGGKVA